MPLLENPDGTIRINIDQTADVEALNADLAKLGLRVAVRIPDPASKASVQEVDWRDVYPKIVPRRQDDEPVGKLIRPSAIPDGHTLLLAVNERPEASYSQLVTVMSLIRGPVPKCVGTVVGFRGHVRNAGPEGVSRPQEPSRWSVRYPGLRYPPPPGSTRVNRRRRPCSPGRRLGVRSFGHGSHPLAAEYLGDAVELVGAADIAA
jgi:hypothetical protein